METTNQKQDLACGQYLIALLAAVLHGRPAPALPQGLTWQQVYAMAREHSVEAMALAGAEPQLQAEPELLAAWRKRRDLDTVQTLTQISEQQRVLAALSAAQIPVLQVKGSAIRALYPRPEFRQMSDIDLIFRQEDLLRARELLCGLGYQVKPSRHPDLLDAELILPPFMGVELHGSLIGPFELYAEYYQTTDVWASAVEDPALPGVYHLRTEDEYIYQLVHFLKHYESEGIGIRQVMDLYVCGQAWGGSMDEAYLAGEYRKIGITEKRVQLEQLARYCFGEASARPGTAVLQMQQDCIRSGAYGSAEMWRVREIQAQQKKGGRLWKVRYFLQRLFPPLRYLRVRYPRLRKAPWLYPFYWLCRLLNVRYWKEHFKTEMSRVNAPQEKP